MRKARAKLLRELARAAWRKLPFDLQRRPTSPPWAHGTTRLYRRFKKSWTRTGRVAARTPMA